MSKYHFYKRNTKEAFRMLVDSFRSPANLAAKKAERKADGERRVTAFLEDFMNDGEVDETPIGRKYGCRAVPRGWKPQPIILATPTKNDDEAGTAAIAPPAAPRM